MGYASKQGRKKYRRHSEHHAMMAAFNIYLQDDGENVPTHEEKANMLDAFRAGWIAARKNSNLKTKADA